MPLPPPPAAAFSITGIAYLSAATRISLGRVGKPLHRARHPRHVLRRRQPAVLASLSRAQPSRMRRRPDEHHACLQRMPPQTPHFPIGNPYPGWIASAPQLGALYREPRFAAQDSFPMPQAQDPAGNASSAIGDMDAPHGPRPSKPPPSQCPSRGTSASRAVQSRRGSPPLSSIP